MFLLFEAIPLAIICHEATAHVDSLEIVCVVIVRPKGLKAKQDSGLGMPFNNTSLVGDLSVPFIEVEATCEGHRVLLVALHD